MYDVRSHRVSSEENALAWVSDRGHRQSSYNNLATKRGGLDVQDIVGFT